jgi:hypothetical protein
MMVSHHRTGEFRMLALLFDTARWFVIGFGVAGALAIGFAYGLLTGQELARRS